VGYSEATPCNFTDIYNADVAGGWGVWTRQGTGQFFSQAHIEVGDGTTTTWLAEENKQLCFDTAVLTAHYQYLFRVRNSATMRLGALLNATEKTTGRGCAVCYEHSTITYYFIRGDDTATVLLYNSFLDGAVAFTGNIFLCGYHLNTNYTTTVKIYNCLFHRCFPAWLSGGNLDLYNLTVENCKNGLAAVAGTIDKLQINRSFQRNVQFRFAGCTVKNVTSKDTQSYSLWAGLTTDNCYLVNADLDDWTIWWEPSPYPTIYRQYEFDLKVVDSVGTGIDSAKVKIWDKDDIIVTNTTTDASGVLATQTLNYGYYNQAGGNTPVMQTPHEMRIYEYGKEMMSSKSSIEQVTDWALTMLTDDHITETTEATVAAYTGITINHTAETITISSNHTLDEIYDYCQYDMIASTKQLDQTMRTSDGVNFVSEYSFLVNTGITVTATDQKLSMVSGETYTLTGTAQFTGIIATTTTTRIPVKMTNIVDGSRYWVGKSSDGSEIFKGTQSGSGTVTGYYEHTADIDIDIRVRKSSASTKYLPWVGDGTLVASLFSLRIKQIQDNIVT